MEYTSGTIKKVCHYCLNTLFHKNACSPLLLLTFASRFTLLAFRFVFVIDRSSFLVCYFMLLISYLFPPPRKPSIVSSRNRFLQTCGKLKTLSQTSMLAL